jgi:hypothetical protein
VTVTGFQQGGDAHLHFDVLHRATGVADEVIASGEGYVAATDDGGVPAGTIGTKLSGPAVAAKCDDFVVLRIQFVSGSGPYVELFAGLSIP